MQSNIFEHIFIKMLFQNFIFKFILKKGFFRQFNKIDVDCGDYVKFNGFVSLHYNQFDSDERRSMLIHYDKGFKKNLIINFSEKI